MREQTLQTLISLKITASMSETGKSLSFKKNSISQYSQSLCERAYILVEITVFCNQNGSNMTASFASSIDEQVEWKIFGRRMPKSEAVFFSQTIVIYIVILTCIVNLSCDNGSSSLWTALLSSSIGYILPNPSLKTHRMRPPLHSHSSIE